MGGKIITWTKENGGTSDDPSVQVFLCGKDGKVQSRCADGQAYDASSLSKWLEEALLAYEKEHPRTAVPFQPPELAGEGEEIRCEAIDAAREAGKPVLLYVGREGREEDARKLKAQVKSCRAFEKSCFGSKKTAEDAEGWLLLRFDLSDEAHAAFLQRYGIEEAPALRMIVAGEESPIDPGTKLKAANLSYHLKKHAPPR